MKNSKYEIDMCEGKILPKLLKLSVPLILSGILQLLFNAADIIVVGNFASDNSLAAVGSTASLVNLMTNVFLGLSVGANILAAQYMGARRNTHLSRTVHTSIFLSIVSGIILTIAGVLFADKLLLLMKTPDEVLALSSLYLRIYFCGMIAMLIYNFGSSILRAKGDTKRPLLYLSISGIINVILNLIFVIFFKMDVAGVALATVISQCVSAFLVIRCLMHEQDAFRLEIKKLVPDKKTVIRILKIGIPAGINGVVFSLSNVVLQSSINGFGPIVMSACAAAASIEGFVWVAMNSLGQCALTFIGQNFGREKYSRLNKITATFAICSACTGIILGTLVCFFGKELLHIYDPRPEILPSGMIRLYIVCGTYFLCGIMDTLSYTIRGLGYGILPTVVSIFGACGLRLLWVFTIFQIPQFHTETVLFISYPITWAITAFMHLVCYITIRKKLPKKDPEPKEKELILQ